MIFTSGSFVPPSKALPEDLSPLQTCLSAQEHDRYRRLQRPDIRQNFLLSRGCLRYVLSIYLNCSPPALNFSLGRLWQTGAKSRQTVVTVQSVPIPRSELRFALHSHNPVGIDIERVRPITHLEKAMPAVPDPWGGHHCPLPRPAIGQPHVFSNTGPPKKPSSKAMGLGLSYPMKHVEVFLETVKSNESNRQLFQWPCHPIPTHQPYSTPPQSSTDTDSISGSQRLMV